MRPVPSSISTLNPDAVSPTRTAARTELFDYLERFYNGQRRHSTLGYLSPRAFEHRRTHEALAT